jgi:hypothetical protein
VDTLDELLDSEEPHGTFHDAKVVAVAYDPVGQTAALTVELCVGDPAATSGADRERRRAGSLELRGVAHWREDRSGMNALPPGVWLASDGPLANAPSEMAQRLAQELRAEEIGWYFFLADSNSFIYCVAEQPSFRWLPIGLPAA